MTKKSIHKKKLMRTNQEQQESQQTTLATATYGQTAGRIIDSFVNDFHNAPSEVDGFVIAALIALSPAAFLFNCVIGIDNIIAGVQAQINQDPTVENEIGGENQNLHMQ